MRRRYHLHPPGLIYLALVALVGVALASRPNNLLVWVFAAMLASVLISGLVSGFMLMRVRVTRSVPRTAPAGEPLVLRYTVRNDSRVWPAMALFIRELPAARGQGRRASAGRAPAGRAPAGRAPASRTPAGSAPQHPRAFIQYIGPRETLVAETVCVPQARGPMRLERLRCETVFPFGLMMKSVRFDQHSDTLVLPRMHRLRAGVLGAIASGALGGSATSRRSGPGSDFLSVREYRPGDSLRHVSWKRSAATGTLAVVERSVEVPPRIHVALDLRRSTAELRVPAAGVDGRELEERAISLAASLLAQADRDGFEIRLSVLGLPSPIMPMRRGHWHLQKALAVLGSLELDAPRDASATIPADRERASMVVVHVDRADLGVGGAAASHLNATQLEQLTVQPAGPGALASSETKGTPRAPQAASTATRTEPPR